MANLSLQLPDSVPLNLNGRGVALVAMPLLNPELPSLAIGLLKAILEADGIPCNDLLAYLDFAQEVGGEVMKIALGYDPIFYGDYLFSGELDLPGVDEETYVAQAVALGKIPAEDVEPLTKMTRHLRRNVVPSFLDRLVSGRDWNSYELIGLTSTFQQHTASLAFARRLKRLFPHIPVVIGGANVWGEMGLAWLEQYPQLDFACMGEGDRSLPELVRSLRNGRKATEVPNIACRQNGHIESGPIGGPLVDLDRLPFPDYSTYFEHARQVRLKPMAVPFETSRGCWWGAKRHCVFCALNNSEMAFRSKSPERVYTEVAMLSRRHHVRKFYAVDNILDRRYIPTLFRRLDEEGSDLSFFFEVKSNMRLDDIRQLARGGVDAIQPGIESLSSHLLRAMRKGVTGIQNVFLLKWAKYFDIHVVWNLLCGFAGERSEHYRQQADWFPLLHHLTPPVERIPVVVQRYAPLFESPSEFGITQIAPDPLYHALYPQQPELERIAYFFTHQAEERLSPEAYSSIDVALSHWFAARERDAAFTYYRSPAGFIELTDTRLADQQRRITLRSPASELYELAGQVLATPSVLARQLDGRGLTMSPSAVRDQLTEFVRTGLAIREDDLFLPLAIPVGRRLFDRPPDTPREAKVSLAVLSTNPSPEIQE